MERHVVEPVTPPSNRSYAQSGRSHRSPRPARCSADHLTPTTLRHPLAPETLTTAGNLARRCGATRFSVLIAGAQVLLARWSGLREVTILTPFDDAADVTVLRRTHRPDEPFGELVVREAAHMARERGPRIPPADEGAARMSWPDADGRPSLHRLFFRVTGDVSSRGAPAGYSPPSAPAGMCDLTVDAAAAELVLRYPRGCFDTSMMRLFARSYETLLAAATAAPTTAVGALLLAGPATPVRSPRELATLLRALSEAPAGTVTGARIVADTDDRALPVGLPGRLQLELHDVRGNARWVDTEAFGRCTPAGEILLSRTVTPDTTPQEAGATAVSSRRLRAESAAGMATQLAALWTARLGL